MSLDATDEEVKDAVRKANVHAAIERLPVRERLTQQ